MPFMLRQRRAAAGQAAPCAPPTVAPHWAAGPGLQERGIELYEVAGGVKEVLSGQLLLADGGRVSFDECLWSTQASAASWLADTGLPVDAGRRWAGQPDPAAAAGAARRMSTRSLQCRALVLHTPHQLQKTC